MIKARMNLFLRFFLTMLSYFMLVFTIIRLLIVVYVNPRMVTNTLWLWGVPKWEIFRLPPPFHTGIPIWKW